MGRSTQMRRSKLIRRVYFELRRSLGAKANPKETLRCAAELVRLHSGKMEAPHIDARRGGIPFSMWPLDSAYADGGWRVLSYESSFDHDRSREETQELKMHSELARLKRGLA